jgi:hypothetical protein
MRAGGLYDGLGGYLNGGVGAQSYIKFTNPPSLTNGILPPYAVVGSDFANNIFGNTVSQDFYEFATYDSGKGVVGFSRVGTYVTNITPPSRAPMCWSRRMARPGAALGR